MNRIYLLMLTLLFVGCLREELPVKPTPRGDAVLASVNMQVNYDDQIWYDLGTQRVVAIHPRISWDIGLGSSDTADIVTLNTSCAMQAAITDERDFDAITSVGDFSFYPDHPTGNIDSLAIRGDWIGKVILLDLGYTASGKLRGKRKIQFLEVNKQFYRFQYANLDGSDRKEETIERDPTYNFQTYSFISQGIYQVEPPKEDYDLCFTTYTHLFYDPYLPYLVNGVLMNWHSTAAWSDTTYSFEEIDRSLAQSLLLDDQQDIIGYDWKTFSFANNGFTIDPRKVYVIQDAEGFLFKLRFTDFYNEDKEKGNPTFSFQQL